ncbi:MAG TPA: hypothetical protein VMS18_20110 [Candidatus Binatia bacterium]|nr:hypothetical protein [Candidatus Binatia bacterium]
MSTKRRARPISDASKAITPAPHQTASIQEWHHYSKRKLTCEGCIARGHKIAELQAILKHYRTLIRFYKHASLLKVGPSR